MTAPRNLSTFNLPSSAKDHIIPGLKPWLETEAFRHVPDNEPVAESTASEKERNQYLDPMLGLLYDGVCLDILQCICIHTAN